MFASDLWNTKSLHIPNGRPSRISATPCDPLSVRLTGCSDKEQQTLLQCNVGMSSTFLDPRTATAPVVYGEDLWAVPLARSSSSTSQS